MKRALALPQWYLPEMNREAPQKVRPVFWGISPDDASILYCSDEIIRRAVRTACVARPASGYPRPPQRAQRVRLRGPTRKRVPSRVAQRTQGVAFVAS